MTNNSPSSGAELLLLSDKPIDEPIDESITQYDPFVMNTHEFKFVGAGPPGDMLKIACRAKGA